MFGKIKSTKLYRNLLIFIMVLGPGIITANVDNDAGGITTYSVAGASLGYKLLWVFIPLTVALVVIQEMSARMGAITKKGLADLIRENYGVRMTLFVMIGLLFADLGNTVAEFAGVAASMEIFGVSKYISVPIGAFLVWGMVVRGSYKLVERIFLVASVLYFASLLFAVGLLNASLFAASILPLATAYYICEAFGLEAGINKKWREAPVFYWLYTALIFIGAIVILIPDMPLLQVMLWSQVINGVLLPFILVYMLQLINKPELMGDYVNSRGYNIIAWLTTVIMVILTLLLVVTSIWPNIATFG